MLLRYLVMSVLISIIPICLLLGLIPWGESRMKRIVLSVIIAIATPILWLIVAVMGNRIFGYGIINYILIYGFVPIVAILVLATIWRRKIPRTLKLIVSSLSLLIIVIIGSSLGNYLYKSSITEIGEVESEIYLYDYRPFAEGTLAKTLDEPSNLLITDNIPILDGATALYPLYAAFARAVYPEGDYNPYDYVGEEGYYTPEERETHVVVCNSTSDAFTNLVNGYVDIAFLMGVSESQYEYAEQEGVTLKLTPIGKEAFVFMVNERNTISNLTVEQIKGIYSGKITNWKEVGGSNNAIRAYQRRENSGSQTALQKIMGDTEIMPPIKEDVYSLMMGMFQAIADYKNYKNAIGYSFRFYITGMLGGDGVKLLSIEGIEPAEENIADNSYPFAGDFYAVTVEHEEKTERDKNVDLLIDWILSDQGQELVNKTGYVSIGGIQ